MDAEKIQQMKYSELRKIAKSLGIKANMKADKLRSALAAHCQKNAEDLKSFDKITKKVSTPKSPETKSQNLLQKLASPKLKFTPKVTHTLKSRVRVTPKHVTRTPKFGTPRLATPKAGSGTPRNLSGKRPGLHQVTKKISSPKSSDEKTKSQSVLQKLTSPKLKQKLSPRVTPTLKSRVHVPPKNALGTPSKLSTPDRATRILATPKARSGTTKNFSGKKPERQGSRKEGRSGEISSNRKSDSQRRKSHLKQGKKRKTSQTGSTGSPQNKKRRRGTFEVDPFPDGASEEPRPGSRRSTFEVVPLPDGASKESRPGSRRSTFEVVPLQDGVSEEPRSRSRRSTIEVVPLQDGVSEEPRSRSRRSTIEVKNKEELDKVSPGVTGLIGSMKCNMGDEEMKESLLSALDQKVQKIVKDKNDDKQASGIPRFVAFLAQRREQENKKPVSPGRKNWTKIHKREFDKMESIDVYLEKKKARRDEYNASAKKTRALLEETKAAINKLKSHKTPTINTKQSKSALFKSPSMGPQKTPVPFKPTVMSTANMNLNFASQSRKSPRNAAPVFKPTVMSTKDIDFSFHKTPSTMPKKSKSAVQQEAGSTVPRKSAGSCNRSFVTPFKFNATFNNTMNDTKSLKKTFDLKSSLSKPITWNAHKGKLKPMTGTPVYIKPQTDKNVSVKTPKAKLVTRENRRAVAAKKRADHKFSKQMSRRGINAQ